MTHALIRYYHCQLQDLSPTFNNPLFLFFGSSKVLIKILISKIVEQRKTSHNPNAVSGV